MFVVALRRFRLAALGRWTLLVTGLALLMAAQEYVSTRAEGAPTSWARALATRLPYWYLWAAVAPVVAWLARRFPIERTRAAMHVALHLVFALALSELQVSAYLGTWLLLGGQLQGRTLPAVWLQWSAGWLFPNVIVYAALLAGTLAIGYARRFRDRERVVTRLNERLDRAHVDALRMQLNPHFLLNAMSSIATLVRNARNAEASQMLTSLSAILRQVL